MRIKKYIINLVILSAVFINFVALAKKEAGQEFVIMLDPAGDAKNTGRQIDDSLERGISMQFAQKLKGEIENKFKNIKVVLTRDAGQRVEALQNASFANRLDVDFYLSVHFYKENAVKSQAYVYTFYYKDDLAMAAKKGELHFYPYDMAHLINRNITLGFADIVRSVFLSGDNAKYFDFCGIYSLPFKPLIGVKAPAVAVEIGLNKKDDFNNYIGTFIDIVDKLNKVVYA
jgi:N-acetylmuramoyl-L-alanine amidase